MEEKTINLNNNTGNWAVYSDERIAFVENLQNLERVEPMKLEHFLMMVCLRGQATVNIEGKTYEIRPHDALICHPNIILGKSSASMDLDFRCICLSKEYLQQLSVITPDNTWDVMMFLEKSPVLALTPDEVKGFCLYYDLMRSRLMGSPRRHRKELVDALLAAFLYEFSDVLDRYADFRQQPYSAGSNVFRNFLSLLSSSYPKSRSVSYYADKLCLTPKYLSTVCKEVSGETASELINRYVVKDIDFLLKQRGRSIKEICNELEFPNLSFFGRYVKKHLGLSPKQYREKVLGKGD